MSDCKDCPFDARAMRSTTVGWGDKLYTVYGQKEALEALHHAYRELENAKNLVNRVNARVEEIMKELRASR